LEKEFQELKTENRKLRAEIKKSTVNFYDLSLPLENDSMKQKADNNRNKIILDKLKNGIWDYMMRAEERNELYEFIALYVWKVYSNTLITRELHCMTGCSFLDLIRPGDIDYMIALVKIGRDVWDQMVRMKALSAAAHKEKAKKLKPLFTSGIGKKKEQGKHLWSKEGIKYFKQAETEWIAVYG
jgi:hypothetical protein